VKGSTTDRTRQDTRQEIGEIDGRDGPLRRRESHLEQQDRRTRFEGYLLGTLTEEERAGVCEEAIRDPDAEAELREIEHDLLDAAARGTLDPQRQQRVETYLAAAPHNRDGWQLARALAERETRRPAIPLEVESRVSSRWFAGWPAAAAAVLIAAVGVTFYLRGISPSGPGDVVPGARPDADHVPSGAAPGSASSAPAAPTGTAAGTPGSAAASSSGTPTPPVGTVPLTPSGASPPSPGSNAVASGTGASKVPQAPPKLGPGDIALYLPASILRGSRPEARITSATEIVRLDIEIEAPVPSLVTIAVLPVPSNGEAVWSQVGVPTARVRGGEYIASVQVPARVLPTGAMEVVVTSADKAWTPRVFPVLLRRD
jgi:hypothetical protein